MAGDKDAGGGGGGVRDLLDALQGAGRLQQHSQGAVHEPLVPHVLQDHGVHQQRHQPGLVQRHVRQVP